MFGLGSTELLRENSDSTKTWRMERDSYRMIIYAGDYIREEIPVERAGITVNFYYSRKHQPVMEAMNAAESIRQTIEYCTEHIGPLSFYMQRQAATKIDRGIGRAETPTESSQATTSHTMTDFKAQRGKRRYWGSGYLGRTKGGRWNGRYTVTWPDGTKRTRDIYADSEEECEKLLAVMITEMKTEVAAERERLRAENRAS